MRKLTPAQLKAMKCLLSLDGGVIFGGAVLYPARQSTIERLRLLGYITDGRSIGPRTHLYAATDLGRDAVNYTEGKSS